MEIRNYDHGKFFGPAQIFAGYTLIAVGLLFLVSSPFVVLCVVPGTFMALTRTGTIIDFENSRIKSFTRYCGFISSGSWTPMDRFSRFVIQRSSRSYIAYSRGSVSSESKISDVTLSLTDPSGRSKVLIGRFKSFEVAQKEKEFLENIIFPMKIKIEIEE